MSYPDYLPTSTQQYVPNAVYSSDITDAGLTRISLGTPAAADVDAISAATAMVNGSAVTVNFSSSQGIIADKYGRTLTFVASTTNTRGVTITGRDYMGQPVTETLTLTSGTAIETAKAYKKVESIVYASASDTSTVNVGYSNTFGLPYAIADVKEERFAGLVVPGNNGLEKIDFEIEATELAAGTSTLLVSPVKGYVTGLDVIVQTAIGTGGDITVELDGTPVTGLSVSVASSATVGTAYSDVISPIAAGLVQFGGDIEIVPASAFATTGAVNGFVTVNSANAVAAAAGTQTATSADPRGLYTPRKTPDGTSEIELLASVVNGNIYGNAHYTA